MEKIKLGDLCKPSAGQIKEDEDTLIDYIDISSVDNETKKITGYQTIIFGESPSRARKVVKRGNILVSTVRPNLNAVALLEEDTPNVTVASTGFCVLESKDDVDPRFIFNFCKSKPFIDDMVSQATGASYPAVSDKIVRSALVPKYSYQEQQSISSVLDKLTGIIDSRRTELLELDNLIKARFVEMFGDTVLNPLGWEEHRLEEFIDFLTSGSRGWSKYFTDQGNELFITIKNVKNNHIILDELQYVNAPKDKEAERTRVKAGDLLISITADLGRTGVVDERIAAKGAYINQHLSLIRLKQECVNPLYVSYYLETTGGKLQFESKNQNGVKAGLNFDAVKSLKILVPPKQKQDEYIDFVNQVDKSKVAVQKALDETQLLFDSLMQEYFG